MVASDGFEIGNPRHDDLRPAAETQHRMGQNRSHADAKIGAGNRGLIFRSPQMDKCPPVPDPPPGNRGSSILACRKGGPALPLPRLR